MTDNVPVEPTPEPAPTSPAEAAPTEATEHADDAPDIPAPSFHVRKGPLIVTLIAVLVIALLAAGIGYWTRGRPIDLVKGYLAALARADANAALGYGCNPASGPYLTDAVLARSQQLAPLSVKSVRVPKVPSVTPNGFDVTQVWADVTMGDNPSTLVFGIVHKPGHLCLLATYVAVDVITNSLFTEPGSIPLAAIAQLLNGAAVEGNQMHLFPGTYELTTPNTLVVMKQNTFTVTDTSSYSDPDLGPVKIDVYLGAELADGVPQQLTTLAMDDLSRCLKETTTRTSCGFGTQIEGDLSRYGIQAGDFDPSSVRWSLDYSYGGVMPTPSKWLLMLWTPANYAYYAVCTEPNYISLNLSVTLKSGDPRGANFLVLPVVNLSDPDNPKVEWPNP